MASSVGLLSKDIKLSYKSVSTFTPLDDLMEIPELGGTPEQVEVTTLADGAKRYIRGIKDYGSLDFKFLYDNETATSAFRVLKGLEASGAATEFKVELPDGTAFTFTAQVAVKLDSAAVNAALTFTASLSLNSDMAVANPGV